MFLPLFPIPYSLFPIPYSLFPIPYSLFPGRSAITNDNNQTNGVSAR
ncbi:MAG: hypothetical protein F6K26_01045 [Moorea sp. SIO2I5]|nr:hypothetical protein [Moorena sp. SIO2I5]